LVQRVAGAAVAAATALGRAALPAATALTLAKRTPLRLGRELTALEGLTVLSLAVCCSVTDDVIARLPPTLRMLNVSMCQQVTKHASFTHLPVLESLNCNYTDVVATGLARLPSSLCELRMCGTDFPITADFSHLRHLRELACGGCSILSSVSAASLPPLLEVLSFTDEEQPCVNLEPWPRGWSVAHLTRLRVLKAPRTKIDDPVIASLPPSLRELNLELCDALSSAVSFAHLPCLRTLVLRRTSISSAALAALPPSLASLDLRCSSTLTPATVFPDLPALRVLDVSYTDIGDAAIASMPAGLEELTIVGCVKVTQHASLDHLVTLRVLQSVGTVLLRAAIAACRARGCFAPADGSLALKGTGTGGCMAPLPGGRLVTGVYSGQVTLWKAAAGRNAVPVLAAELQLSGVPVYALAVLPDGHRVAVGTSSGIVVWDTSKARRNAGDVSHTTIACKSGVRKLAAARHGRLVAGCADGKLHVVNVNTGSMVATLAAHTSEVTAVVGLLDGRVASAAHDREIMLWNLGTGACVSTLMGHSTESISSLAVLPDSCLASGSSWDRTVRLWDVRSGACIRVLTGHTVHALTALPCGRLAIAVADGTIRVRDTRDDAGGPPLVLECVSPSTALAPLPGNRLASIERDGVYLWQLPPHAT